MSDKYYDNLLPIFLSEDDIRPAMKQANTVGDKLYATDGKACLMIPKFRVKNEYPAHAKVPDYQRVLDYIKPCEPVTFLTSDLMKVLSSIEKEYDTEECPTCEGSGNCSHCGAGCEECEGSGQVENTAAPKIYPIDSAAIVVQGRKMSPYQLGRMETVLCALDVRQFTLLGLSEGSLLFGVADAEILIAKLSEIDDHDHIPVFNLDPAKEVLTH